MSPCCYLAAMWIDGRSGGAELRREKGVLTTIVRRSPWIEMQPIIWRVIWSISSPGDCTGTTKVQPCRLGRRQRCGYSSICKHAKLLHSATGRLTLKRRLLAEAACRRLSINRRNNLARLDRRHHGRVMGSCSPWPCTMDWPDQQILQPKPPSPAAEIQDSLGPAPYARKEFDPVTRHEKLLLENERGSSLP